MVKVSCEKCGQIHDLPKGETLESYVCSQCNGELKYIESDRKAPILNKEHQREILLHKRIHAERMGETYTLTMIGGIVLVIGSLFMMFLFLPSPPLIVFLILGGLVFSEARKKRRSWIRGAKGEKSVVNKLNELPKEYFIFNDLKIPSLKGNIDHVVIGPTGVFALETKNYSNNYTINGDEWTLYRRQDKIIHNDPGKQARRNAVGLMTYLSQSGISGLKWVYPIVILVIEDSYEIKKPPKNYKVLNPSQLIHHITHNNTKISTKTILESSLMLKKHCSQFSYYPN